VGGPERVVDGQTQIICRRVLTFGIQPQLVPLPQVDFANWGVDGVQQQYRYGSVSLEAEHMYFAMTDHSMPGLEVGSTVSDPNVVLWH